MAQMKNEIVNRVASSPLVTVDLEEYFPEGARKVLDISQWLWEGIVLREKDFREYVKSHDFSQYRNAFVAIQCSTEAIIPGWANMLVASKLHGVAHKTIVGSLNDLENLLFADVVAGLDISKFKDKPIIIKGCTHKSIPENAYILLVDKLQPIAKSILYGEACSSVPLFKRR